LKNSLKIFIFSLQLLFVLSNNCFAKSKPKTTKDEVLYSFVVVGCNRLDKEDTNMVSNPSTANVFQMMTTFNDVAKMNPRPNLFFMAGDLVMGYNKDTSKLGTQLRAWIQLYKKSDLGKTDIKMVVMPGNHESMPKKGQPANKSCEDAFVNNMKEYIVGNNGPKVGMDSLTTDQSQLTYSFDYKNAHFIILNTDAAGQSSRVPNSWIKEDISKNGKNKLIFAIGHKPAYPSPKEKGLNEYSESRDIFWNTMESNDAVAMIAAHNHRYYSSLPKTKTWSIISGHGGSPLDEHIEKESDKFFGFVVVSVYKSGRVTSTCYGRDLPKGKYYDENPTSTTTIRETLELKK